MVQQSSTTRPATSSQPNVIDRKAYLVGGGIGSLAAAAFMVRDGSIPGSNITIYEAMPVLGGSLDGGGNPTDGYILRGGRMLTTDNYECTWDLFKSIPSVTSPGKTVFDETIEFNELNQPHSRARLVDQNRAKIDVESMGFSMQDRLELLKLTEADEEQLGTSRITDWLSPPFFQTNFWFMWSTTFAFQPWHSAVEFRRYLHRFMMEFSRIETLAGVKRTVYNQFDSLVQPLLSWLEEQGVKLVTNCNVSDFELKTEDGRIVVKAIQYVRDGKKETIAITDEDLVFFQEAILQEEVRQEAIRQEAILQEEVRQEEVRQEAIRQEAILQEEVRQEAIRQEAILQEEVRQEGARQEEVRQDKARQEEVRQDKARQEEARQEEVRQEAIRQGAIRRGVGTFSSYETTEIALGELKNTGFLMDRVSLVGLDINSHTEITGAHTSNRLADVGKLDTSENKAEGTAKDGAIGGGAVGGFAGLLVGLGLLFIPGVGPVMLAGAAATAIATAVSGGVIGAVAGSLVGGLIGLGIPADRAKVYSDRISQGDYLVMVEGSEADIAQAESIFSNRGIHDWHVYDYLSDDSVHTVTTISTHHLRV
jgi:hypothetical protein